jgi:hypothetical protein
VALSGLSGFGNWTNKSSGLEKGVCQWQYGLTMSVAKLKDGALALPTEERHEFVAWANRRESDYGDVPGETLDQPAAELRNQDGRYAPPTHPAR